MDNFNKLNIVLGVIALILCVLVYITAKTIFSILILVVIILFALNVTGALHSLYTKITGKE